MTKPANASMKKISVNQIRLSDDATNEPGKRRKPRKKPGSKKHNIDRTFMIIMVIMGIFILFFLAVILMKNVIKTNDDIEAMYKKVLSGKESETGYMYNGFVFVRANDLWYSKLQKGSTLYNVPFRYGPKEVERIPIEGDVYVFGKSILQNKSGEVYMTFDPLGNDLKYVGLATGELNFKMIEMLGMTPVAACTNNLTDACHEVPIMNCSSDSGSPTILLSQDMGSLIKVQGSCLTIYGRQEELIKSVDRLLFTWISVIRK